MEVADGYWQGEGIELRYYIVLGSRFTNGWRWVEIEAFPFSRLTFTPQMGGPLDMPGGGRITFLAQELYH